MTPLSLSEAAREALDRWLKVPHLAEERPRYFEPLMDINCAHVMMLGEQGLISADQAAVLLRAIEKVRRTPTLLDRQCHREDLYFMVEAAIIAEAGDQVGGQMHIGRSRNDINATLARMALRSTGWELHGAVLTLVADLLSLAQRHITTIMPGYTHLRPAQPTTLGHYLTGLVNALRRDITRLAGALQRANECPMGAAAFAGTSFDIDRERVAGLLGFDRPMAHSLDAVASRDAALEVLGTLAIMATTLARFTHDLYTWSTVEFGFVVLDPMVAGSSSIMPQKRNPNVLERCRAKAAHLIAALVDALVAEKGTGFMHCQDVSIDSVAPLWAATQEMRAMVEVLRAVVPTLEFDARRLLQWSTSGFALATEVADELVRSRGMAFRTAHTIVSRVAVTLPSPQVGEAMAGEIATRLNRAAVEVTGVPLDLTAADLAPWLDPVRSVREKRSLGAPAPAEVSRMLGDLTAWHQHATGALDRETGQLAAARIALQELVETLTTRPS